MLLASPLSRSIVKDKSKQGCANRHSPLLGLRPKTQGDSLYPPRKTTTMNTTTMNTTTMNTTTMNTTPTMRANNNTERA
eukprot:scaffold10176_cov211-Alexandrium_tamarense.AAC.2